MYTDLRTIIADQLEELIKEARVLRVKHESEVIPEVLNNYLEDLIQKIEVMRIAVQDGIEDAPVRAANTLSHEQIVEAARIAKKLGTCDED